MPANVCTIEPVRRVKEKEPEWGGFQKLMTKLTNSMDIAFSLDEGSDESYQAFVESRVLLFWYLLSRNGYDFLTESQKSLFWKYTLEAERIWIYSGSQS